MVFYQGDYARQMEAVLHGEVDVGLMLSGWMEANYPQNVPLFRYLEPKPPVFYQSERFPFPTSTDLVPSLGVVAAPDVPWTLQQQVMTALSALNATQPEAVGAGIARFTLAASYALTREIGTGVGVFYESPARGITCHDPFEPPRAFLFCPPGYMKDDPTAIAHNCERRGVVCPHGLVCVCRPCVPARAVNVFPWQAMAGLCATLFVAALGLTVGWRVVTEIADPSAAEPASARRRHGRGWKLAA